MWTSAILLVLAAVTQAYAAGNANGGLPVDKVYGVNLGSWLLTEPWMLPNEWVRMGGESCYQTGSCADCAASEFDLVKKLGQQKADEVFQQHWETWFSENDVQDIVGAGLNTVRIPIGYWIIEPLVNRDTEFYPRGGLKQLKRGVEQLASAGINVLLDFHAMPGVSSANQMFAGRCIPDVEFYSPPNYFRALQWAAVTTYITHIDPAFRSVFGIEAINEPIMDPAQTPGYGDYLTDFAQVVRAVELSLGIRCPGVDYASLFNLGVPTNGPSPANATASASNPTVSPSGAAASSSSGKVAVSASTATASVGDVISHAKTQLNVKRAAAAAAAAAADPLIPASDTNAAVISVRDKSTAIPVLGKATAATRGTTASKINAISHRKRFSRVKRAAAAASDTTIPGLAAQRGGRVGDVLRSIIPMLEFVADELGMPNPVGAAATSIANLPNGVNKQCLHTTFMDAIWQSEQGFNPAQAAVGPAMFDDHLYFSFGGVADPTPESYLKVICNLPRVKNDADLGNVPMVFGEWALSTNFNPTNEFLTQWADAQKLMYAQSSGWIFWGFKIEDGNFNMPQWDYFTALEAGHFTRDPAALNDPHVCDPYLG